MKNLLFMFLFIILASSCSNSNQNKLEDALRKRDISNVKEIINLNPHLATAILPSSKLQPIHIAVINNDIPTANFLISKGANIKAVSKEGHLPIDLALFLGHKKMVSFLVKNGQEKNFFVLSALGETDLIKKQLKNEPSLITKEIEGTSALGITVIFNELETGKYLLSQGAQIESNQLFYPPLTLAVSHNRIDFLNLFLKHFPSIMRTKRQRLLNLAKDARKKEVILWLENLK